MSAAVSAHLIALIRSRIALANAQAGAGMDRAQLFERQSIVLMQEFGKTRGLDLDGATFARSLLAPGQALRSMRSLLLLRRRRWAM